MNMTQSILTIKIRLYDSEYYNIFTQPRGEAISFLAEQYSLLGRKMSVLSNLVADSPVTLRFSVYCIELAGPSDLIEKIHLALEEIK